MLQAVIFMNIQLLKTTDDQRKAFKTCTQIGADITAVPTDDMSELQPKIVINYDSTYLAANYVYIELFGKYYKIDKKAVTIGKKIVLECTIDAVMSYYSDILNCDITAVRNGGIGSPTKIQDNKLPINPETETIQQIPVENVEFKQLLDYPYVLQVIGG